MRTRISKDGKLEFEPLSRELSVIESFEKFLQQCREFRSLEIYADTVQQGVTRLKTAIDGDPDGFLKLEREAVVAKAREEALKPPAK